MKFYIGIYRNEMVFIKEENHQYFKVIGYSDNSFKFYQIPHKPKILAPVANIENEYKVYPKRKHVYHKAFNKFLKQNNYSDYKLITETVYENSLQFTIISNKFVDFFDENEKLIKLTKTLNLGKEIEDFDIHCLSEEVWNSRRY